MSTSADPSQSLNEISHLFLSSVRERQMDGAPRPQRIPPGGERIAPGGMRVESSSRSHSIDLSPEEFAGEFPEPSDDLAAPEMHDGEPVKALSIALGAHFGSDYRERVYAYAKYLGRTVGRVGLIFADDSTIQLSCFDKTEETGIEPEMTADVETFVSLLAELNCDVNRWVIATNHPRGMFDQPRTAILLASCDHEGVVEAYRTLKGLAGFCPENVGVALFEARDLRDAQRVHRKLASVADQFLGCAIDLAAIVIPTQGINRHPLTSIPAEDEAWEKITEYFASAPAAVITAETTFEATPTMKVVEAPKATETVKMVEPVKMATPVKMAETMKMAEPMHAAGPVRVEAGKAESMKVVVSDDEMPAAPAAIPMSSPMAMPMPMQQPVAAASGASDVVDLPGGCTDEDAILSAMVREGQSKMVECPLRPPMLKQSRMVVDRERKITLIAVATQGLSDLQTIAKAYRWMSENRALVAMALPQMNIDALALPQLRLLIDHQDASAMALQTLMQSGCVQLQTYRKLRWGGKTGLLLEAA